MARTNHLPALGFAFGSVLLASVPGMPRADEKPKELDRSPVACVMANFISRKVAIDNKTIVFYVKGNKFFRVDLPAVCPTLAPGDTELELHYSTQSVKLTRLCNYDSFTVEHKAGAGCPLGKFNPITAAEAAALAAKTQKK